MDISVETATFWFLPFEQTIEIIANAGFEHIELGLFREIGEWGVAQQLKDIEPKKAIQMIHQAGLKVSVIHDGWGVMSKPYSVEDFVNPQLPEFLDQLGYAPGCIAFHAPHIKGDYDKKWWQGISERIATAARSFRTDQTVATIENMPLFDGYYVPLPTPEDLMAFVSQNDLDVTMDVTHYPQIGIDPIKAARVLRKRVKSLHLSDFLDGNTHLFVGDGNIDFVKLFQVLDLQAVRSATLEYMIAPPEEPISSAKQTEFTDNLKTAKARLEGWIEAAENS